MSIITRINKAEKRIVDLYNKLKNLPSGGGSETQYSYSIDETLTGGTWIDGKPIYRKVFVVNNNVVSTVNSIDLLGMNISTLLPTISGSVRLSGSVIFSGGVNTFFINDGDTLKYSRYKANNNSVDNLQHELILNYGSNTLYSLILILEYTKTTD